MGQKVLVVGSGGREHAIVKKLLESKHVTEVICAPGNGGISLEVPCFDVSPMDINAVVELAKNECVDIVFVAPDDPLAAGLVDVLSAHGIRAFGPTAAAAQIEASKVFSKNLMKKYGIPTAGFEVFDNAESALTYIKSRGFYPAVIKADGLALGKGVIIAETFETAEKAVNEIMRDKIFGESGSRVVVEDFITGPEVSVLAFCDGKTVLPMVSAMDHKRALDGDKGLNTGGMGTIAPNPYYTEDIAQRCMTEIFLPTMKAMAAEGCPFKGCLFFGLMITQEGPKVIEYNARFGDPETQVVLPLLKSDFLEIIEACIDGTLEGKALSFEDSSAACVVMASGGYPEAYQKGKEIYGLSKSGQVENALVFHAGTKIEDGKIFTNGGRVLGVTAKGETLDKALENAYKAVSKLNFENAHFRTDIGRKKF